VHGAGNHVTREGGEVKAKQQGPHLPWRATAATPNKNEMSVMGGNKPGPFDGANQPAKP
jgi:hypothetical protein